MKIFKLISLILMSTTLITACDDGSFSNVLDSGLGKSDLTPVVCKISTVLPTTATLKMAATGGSQNFVVGGADSTCAISWKFNGTTLESSDVALNVLSSQLIGGSNNTLEVSVSNGTSTDTHSWEITKNNPPSCVVKSPASNPAAFVYTTTQSLSAAGADSDVGDVLGNFAWKLDDVSVPSVFTDVTNSSIGSSATFVPNASGTHKVSLVFSDSYDYGECSWSMNMTGGCSIDSSLPIAPSKRMPSTGGTENFSITSNNAACIPSWTLNGSAILGSTNSQSIISSQLIAGSNTLTVSISNGTSTTTRTWTIEKNNPPTCNVKSPSTNPSAFAYGTSKYFSASSTDTDGDIVSGYTWKFNDAAASSLFTSSTDTLTGSSSTFTPGSSQVGTAQKVSLVFSDGYDTGECSWTTQITNQCSVASSYPSSLTYKMSAAASSTQTFAVTPNDASCSVTWALNTSPLSGTNPTQSITSSQLNTGSGNTLIATISNGTSSITRSWTISKNTVPSCALKAPGTNPAAFSYNGTQSLSAAAADADGDSLSSFVWKYNDSTNYSSLFVGTTDSAIGSSTTFTPTSSQIGSSQKVSLTFSDSYDTNECSWTMNISDVCSILSSSPSGTSFKMPSSGGSQDFTIGANNSACVPSWTFNGAPLAGSQNTKTITSSLLSSAPNTLAVIVSNGTSSTSKSWTITKNVAPTCNNKTPSSNPAAFAHGTVKSLNADGVDSDGDTLTGFTWKFNDQAAPTLFSTITSITNGSAADFTSTSAQVGSAQKVSLTFTDGYDSAECSWTMNISNQCTVTSSFPSSSTFKMAQAGSTAQDFTVVPSDSSCNISWTLGGSAISGTSALKTITSSLLSPGAGAANTLIATVSNGTSSASQTWSLVRNQIPSCGSKTPATNPSAFVYTNNTKVFSGTASDPDGDSLTSFTWKYNDNATPSTIFTGISSSSPTSSMTFVPTSSQIGTGQKLSVVFSDGYDTGECYWNFDVANTCSITSSSPATTTYKVANSGSASQNYVIVPNDSGCTATWTLTNASNSGGLALGSGSIKSLLGSQLDAGNGNTLSVSISNGVSSDSKSWTVTRNQVPACASKTPASNPANFAYTTNTNSFTGTGSDADGDSLINFSWKFNDNASPASIYTALSPSSPTTTQSMTFVPTATQVGASQKLALSFYDGYDTGECYWNFGVNNPNTVALTSCNPVTNPVVVTTTGGTSSKDLQINAINASSYAWTRGGSTVSGATSSMITVNQASGSAGSYTYVATATDVLGSTPVQCTYNVKINGLPVIGSATPSASQTWKLGWGSTMAFSVSATDPNSDSLSYTWKVDGTVQTSYLNSTTSSATFSPNYSQTLIDGNNPHTISVEVNDGSEYVTQSWTVEVNKFSSDCNTLLNGPSGSYNASTSVSTGGRICTLIGVPGTGGGVDPTADQSLVRLKTAKVIDDGSGNWWVLDFLNNVVLFYNRSGSTIGSVDTPYFGIPGIPAGKMAAVIGNGTAGVTADNNYNTSVKIDTGGSTSTNGWGGLAYDPAGPFLYVADWSNGRVIRVDGRSGGNNGKVTTILGQIPGAGTVGNNTAGNTEAAIGTSHYCLNPADVHIATTGGIKYLYVTCYSSHTVKRMIADHTLGTYGNTYTVVGRLGAGVSAWGAENGALGPTGDARTSYPWSLGSDSSGNIYYAEGTNNSTGGGSRVRMINYSGSTATLFGGTTSQNFAFTLQGTDKSGTPLTAPTGISYQALLNTGLVANKATMWGATPNATSACVELKLQTFNGTTPANISGPITFTLTNNVAASDIYVNSACSSQVGLGGTQPSRTFSMANATNELTLYFKNTTAGSSTATLALSSSLATNTGMSVSTSTPGAQSMLRIVSAATFDQSSCQKIFVQVRDAAGTGIATNSLGSTRTIRMFHNGVGTYYSDDVCTTPAYNVSITNGSTQTALYYKANAQVPNNEVHSIIGTGSGVAAYPNSTYPTAPTLANGGYAYWGQVAFNQPRGLAVHEVAGSVKGFFISAYNYQRTIYVNNDASARLIGSNLISYTTPPYQGNVVAGTGTAAYNSDGLGVITRTYFPLSTTMTADGNGVIISDSGNARVRVLDLTGSGSNAYNLTTYLGVGRTRAGSLGDSPVAATSMYLNYPRGMTIDNSNRLLYTVDSSNGRIRRTNLLNGEVDTIIGNGVGAGATDGIDPTTVQMSAPKGLAMVNRSGTNFLLYSDTQNLNTANNNCQIRALNLNSSNGSPAPTNFYTSATSIGANKVSTIAGDYGLGCGTMASISSPTNTKMNMPEGIAVDDNGNILAALYRDHCIIKITPAGVVSVLVGNAGVCTSTTGTAGDGSDTTNAVVVLPTAVVPDPRFSSYGNFFFADAYTNNPSRIRYVNYSPSSVKVGSVTVPGATAPNGVVVTIWTIGVTAGVSAATPGYINALTTVKTSDNVTHLCYAAGLVDNGTNGAHNVQCYDVGNGAVANLGTPDLRIGTDHTSGSSVRGGTTVDSSQEGAAANTALLYAPYGLTFDSSGNLYISEMSSHQVRMVRRWW